MKNDSLKIQSYFMLGALALQYLLGMAVNLFVAFPDNAEPRILWEFARNQGLVLSHIIIGLLLLIGSIIFLIQAIRRKEKNWLIAAIIGFLAILGAFISGMQFVPTQQDTDSYTMAVTFIIAVFSYGWGLSSAKK